MSKILPQILLVDDDANILSAFSRQLRADFAISTASDPIEALASLNPQKPYAVVVSDMRMPKMNGVSFLSEFQRRCPDTVRIMLTGNADMETAITAVNQTGIFRFLNKPCSIDNITKALHDAVSQYQLVTSEKQLLQQTLGGSVKLLTDMLALIDPATFESTLAARDLAKDLANAVGAKNLWEIELSLMLSRIGAIALPPETLQRYRDGKPLSTAETKAVSEIPTIGQKLLANIPRLEGVAKIVGNWGRNFDSQVSSKVQQATDQIPIGSRIIRLVLDLMHLGDVKKIGHESSEKLSKSVGVYDPQLLTALAKLSEISPTVEVKPTERTGYKVQVSDLCVGQHLLEPLFTKDGKLLIGSGNLLTETLIEKIKTYSSLVGLREMPTVDSRIPTVVSQ